MQTSAAEGAVGHDTPATAAAQSLSRRVERDRRRRQRRRASLLSVVVLVIVVILVAVLASAEGPLSVPRPVAKSTDQSAPTLSTSQVGTDGTLPFSPTSVWNQALPDDAPLATNSDALVRGFNQQWQQNYGTVGINTRAFSVPVYTVPEDQPTVRVGRATGPHCSTDPAFDEQVRAVPIPSGARPAAGTDGSIAIWQPSTDTAWELWELQGDARSGWSACWGGRIKDVSHSNGVFPWPYGVAASGLSYLGGTIKASELKAGEINHALAVGMVHTTEGTQVLPANRNDGNSTDEDAVPEGTRFRLDPKVDVTTLGLSPSGVVIARALQRYGMYVTDTSGAVVLMAEDGQAYADAGGVNPFTALFAPEDPSQVLSWIPWTRLQVIAPPS